MTTEEELQWLAAVLTERADLAEAQNKLWAITGCTEADIVNVTAQAESIAARTGQGTAAVIDGIASGIAWPSGPHR